MYITKKRSKRFEKFKLNIDFSFFIKPSCENTDEDDLMVGVINKSKKEISQIDDDGIIFVAGIVAITPKNLKKYNIRFLMNCATEKEGIIVKDKLSDYTHTMYSVNMEDNNKSDLNKNIEIANKIISKCVEQNESILIFCQGGISRSTSITMGYYITVKNYSFKEAFDLLKAQRPCTDPNGVFLMKLKNM